MKHNEFVTKKHKKTCKTLNYVELIFLSSTFTDWVLISVFTSIVDILVEITRSKVGLIVCVMGVGIKKYKSIIIIIIIMIIIITIIIIIIIKTENSILSKSKVNSIEVLISNAFNSNILVTMILFQ